MENVKKTELFSYYEQDHNTIHKTRKNLNTLKKTLIELKNPNKPILYFDESRFGTKTKTSLGWFKKGIRTPISEHQLKSNWDLRIFTFIQVFIQLAVSISHF